MNADLEEWRKNATHPFDDRNIYKGVYAVQELSEMMQIEAAIILQDINARRAIKALRDPVFARQPEAPPIAQGLVPDKGLCGEARRQKALLDGGPIPVPEDRARWIYAAEYCDDSSVIVKNTYKRLVQQIEFAGAPYTTDSVVVSLSGKVFGHGDSTNNWLWINWGKVAPEEVTFLHEQNFPVRPNNWDYVSYYIGKSFKDGGEANWYSDNLNMTGLWQGASDAWLELYANYDSFLKNRNEKGDLLDMMSKIETQWASEQSADVIIRPFAKITDMPFWVSHKKFDMEWNRVVSDDGLIGTKLITKDVRCFVAADINPRPYYSSGGYNNPHEPLRLTGMVCSSEGFAGMCTNGKAEPPDSVRLHGNGDGYYYNDLLPSQHSVLDGGDIYYSKYASLLGGYVYLELGGWAGKVDENAVYFRDGLLMHYPVVDLKSRACDAVLVSQGVAEDPVLASRGNSIVRGDGVEIPTRCGKDMDKFIEDRVPRPLLPAIPVDEVRKAVY